MKRSKKFKIVSLIFLILFCVYLQSVVYSAISSKLTITGDSVARIRSNVRINSFKIYEVSDGVISSYEDFSKSYTMSNVTLPYSDSYIIYELVVGNYEDVEMQLHSISGLNSNLTYELIDYNLNDAICDSTGKCFGGVEKTLYLKIMYATYDLTTTNYNINLEYEFKEFSNVLVAGYAVKSIIPSTATHFIFTDDKPADGVELTDVSAEQDMGVVGYLDGTTYKVSTRRTGVKPKANADSSYMFETSSLLNIDLSMLDISLTTNIIGMFQDCSNLVSINFGEDWDTSNIYQMKYLFKGCSSLTSIDLSGFNTSKVISFSNFFNGCSSLTSLDVSNFNTAKSSSFSSTFKDCSLLKVIDVSSFDVSYATTLEAMFSGCSSITSIDVSHWNITKSCNLGRLFAYCSSLETINANNLVNSFVTSIECMFYDNSLLKNLYMNNWDTSSITSLYGIFKSNTSIESLDLTGWDVGNVTNGTWVFEKCTSMTYLNLSGWKFKKSLSLKGMFHGMEKLETLLVEDWDTSSVTSFSSLFVNNYGLSSLDLSSWDTSSVTDMDRMFHNDRTLVNIYVGDGWDMSNVTNSSEMFYYCIKLPNYDSNYIVGTNAHYNDGGYLTSKIQNVNIDGVTYQYEDGMTWEEWVDSEYNTIGLYVIDDGNYIYKSSYEYLCDSSNNIVVLDTVIDGTRTFSYHNPYISQ